MNTFTVSAFTRHWVSGYDQKGKATEIIEGAHASLFFGWLAFLDHLYNRGPGTGYQCTGKGKEGL